MSDPAEDVTSPPPAEAGEPPRRRNRHTWIFIACGLALVAAIILIAVPFMANLVQGAPSRYTAQDKSFSATFPGAPTVAPSAKGQLFVRWKHNSTSISVQSRLLAGQVSGENVDAVLTRALTSGSTALGGAITEQIHPITIGGEHALVVTFGTGGTDTVREVAFIHSGRFFAVLMANTTRAQQNAFLSSFGFAKQDS